MLCYTQQVFHFAQSKEKGCSHETISELSTFYATLRLYIFSSVSFLLRVKGRGCCVCRVKPYEANCVLWIWVVLIRFDWTTSETSFHVLCAAPFNPPEIFTQDFPLFHSLRKQWRGGKASEFANYSLATPLVSLYKVFSSHIGWRKCIHTNNSCSMTTLLLSCGVIYIQTEAGWRVRTAYWWSM